MLKKELAQALGVSAAMVSKLAKRGMPTDSVERAERWRRRHLEPGRVKGVRYEDPKPPRADPVALSTAPLPSDPVAIANALGPAALDDFVSYELALRAALRAVPVARRDEVILDFEVWKLLYGEQAIELLASRDEPQGDALLTEAELNQIEAGKSRDAIWHEANARLTGAELKEYDEIMWGLAAGTWKVAPDPAL